MKGVPPSGRSSCQPLQTRHLDNGPPQADLTIISADLQTCLNEEDFCFFFFLKNREEVQRIKIAAFFSRVLCVVVTSTSAAL